ncbi:MULTISPECIES: MFS transporter [unclassified Microbacterium]|uniref:MFS transporter n=1 Tax=unclassified Microbacterium TaxID=2609290 RepID=UPI00301038FD
MSTPRRAFAAIALSIGSMALLQNLVIPVLPLIEDDLDVGSDAVAWTMTAWLIAAAVATPLLGRVGDLRGRRTLTLVVLAVISVGDLVAALAPSLEILLAGRVLQGVGGALFPLGFGLLRETQPPERLTGAIGAVGALFGIAGAAGTVLAGPVAAALGWRALFVVALVVALAAAVAVLRAVPSGGVRAAGRINLVSAALLSGWLVALMLPLSSGSRWGWASPLTLGLFALALCLLAAWVLAELRSAEPLVDIRLLLHRTIWPVNVGALLIGIAMFGFWGYLPMFLEVPASTGWAFGLGAEQAGLVLLPLLVGMSAAGFLTGPLSRVLPLRRQLVLGTAVMGLAILGAVALHGAVWQLAVLGAVFGAGGGMAYAAMASIIVESVPLGSVGVATGVNANLRSIGSAIGSALMTAIVFGSVDAEGLPFEAGYAAAWITIGVVALAAAGLVALVPVRRRDERRADADPAARASEHAVAQPAAAEAA